MVKNIHLFPNLHTIDIKPLLNVNNKCLTPLFSIPNVLIKTSSLTIQCNGLNILNSNVTNITTYSTETIAYKSPTNKYFFSLRDVLGKVKPLECHLREVYVHISRTNLIDIEKIVINQLDTTNMMIWCSEIAKIVPNTKKNKIQAKTER